jgi:hypothetical protein
VEGDRVVEAEYLVFHQIRTLVPIPPEKHLQSPLE